MAGESPSETHTGRAIPRSERPTAPPGKYAPPSQQTADFSRDAIAAGSSAGSLPPAASAPGADDSPAVASREGTATESRYTIEHCHAEGGIGRVWLACDTQLNRRVAVKTLRPELVRHEWVRRRFFQEAQITGQLEHPGIVPVYELVGAPQSGSPFYSMRFVRGRTLDEASRDYHQKRAAGKEEPLGLVSLLSAFVTVCNTIAYAHSRGVIHRDLKGENVLLGDFGEVFLLDWGVAKVLDAPEEKLTEEAASSGLAVEALRTVHGSIVGTPAYMAPEQAEGRTDEVDRRTDIYGLGAVLYEILTGEPPFSGSCTTEVLEKVTRGSPAEPSKLWPEVPRTLEAACLRALSRSPADRHASAVDLGMEIQSWQETQRRQAEEELRRSRERFELAVRGSQDGLWDWDLERSEVFFSPRWKSIIGYEDHELANDLEEWVRRLHPDERDQVLAANYAHINGATSHYEYEYRLRHKDGSYRWILARGVALRDASGKAYRMAGSHVDITARKQMEYTLRQAEQRYRALVDSAPCGILVVDAEGGVRECNARAAAVLGVPLEQLARETLTGLGHRAVGEGGVALGAEEIHPLLNPDHGQRPERLVVAFRTDNGRLRRVALTSRPIDPEDSAERPGAVIFLETVHEQPDA